MCGIVGAVARRNVVPVLIEGLRKLEYRGYDSAGLAVIDGGMKRVRAVGRVADLQAARRARKAPTRRPASRTPAGPRTAASPSATRIRTHRCGGGVEVCVVHNGIIENHEALRRELRAGWATSSTPTPTPRSSPTWCTRRSRAAWRCSRRCRPSSPARRRLRDRRDRSAREPDGRRLAPRLAAAAGRGQRRHRRRRELPRLRHLGAAAGHQATSRTWRKATSSRSVRAAIGSSTPSGRPATRAIVESQLSADAIELGKYAHYMQKEIFEQPGAIANTLEMVDRRARAVAGPVRRRKPSRSSRARNRC